ncbi:MAG: ATP synthase F1 subunit epsilon [Armatimonadota bacterium]
MAKSFKLEIVVPDHTVLVEEPCSVVAPGVMGSFGILNDHAPLMAELAPGVVTVTYPDLSDELVAIGGGFLQVADNHVVILADSAEREKDIDVQRAMEAYERAREHLDDPNYNRAEARRSLDKAMARMHAAGQELPH